MTYITHINQHKAAIAIALVDGIRTARSEIADLNKECVPNLKEIGVFNDWIVELLDALQWLNGKEFLKMEALYIQKEVKK